MVHDARPLQGAVMHVARPLRFHPICVLAAVMCATISRPVSLLVGCGAERRTADDPNLPRQASAMPAAPPDASVAAGRAATAAAMRGSHRSPGAADRDQYRHPVETLAFFGFTPTMTVLDVGAAPGYYAVLLAPVLAKDGLYLATNTEPPSSPPEPSLSSWGPYAGVRFDEMLRASPALYGKVQVVRVDYDKPKLNLDGKVDMVLVMREIHMMVNWGTFDDWLREIHRALKPSGIVGVEEHRAAPGVADGVVSSKTGYVPEAWVIAKFEAAGFALAGKSEINANPKDTKDYPNGVWSLPPSYYAGPVMSPHPAGAADRAKYAAIGESDRMTLKFVRVGEGVAR
jgi:predicted methyltransferase